MTADPVATFQRLAIDYCALIEEVEATAGDEVLRRLRRILPALLVAAEDLPDHEPSTARTPPAVEHETWAGRFNAVGAVLGAKGGYWTTSHVTPLEEPEPLYLTLATTSRTYGVT